MRLLVLASALSALMLSGCQLGLGDLSGFDRTDALVENEDDPETASDDDDAVGDDDDAVGDDDDAPVGEDFDGDGHSVDVDCDDYDPEVHPGAVEVACDGVDNDCDGTFLAEDMDNDGDGYSPCLGDCDDSDPQTGVNGIEVDCDGIDQDCDGVDDCDPGDDPVDDPADDPVDDPGGVPTGSICSVAGSFGAAGSGAIVGFLDTTDPTYGTAGTWYFDSFMVTAPWSGPVTIDLVSFDFDAWVEVFDSSCNYLGYDDDSLLLLGTDASYTYTASAGGTFYVLASSFDELATGAYLLDIY